MVPRYLGCRRNLTKHTRRKWPLPFRTIDSPCSSSAAREDIQAKSIQIWSTDQPRPNSGCHSATTPIMQCTFVQLLKSGYEYCNYSFFRMHTEIHHRDRWPTACYHVEQILTACICQKTTGLALERDATYLNRTFCPVHLFSHKREMHIQSWFKYAPLPLWLAASAIFIFAIVERLKQRRHDVIKHHSMRPRGPQINR